MHDNQKHGTNYNMPVYYFTELIAMCLGATPKEVGIDKHYFPATSFAENAVKAPAAPAAEAPTDAAEAQTTKKEEVTAS